MASARLGFSETFMKDLHNPALMWLKAVLFLLIGGTSSVLIWLRSAELVTAVLLILTIWAFCRAYYFAFYVLEKYIDPGFRYAGLTSLVARLFRRSR